MTVEPASRPAPRKTTKSRGQINIDWIQTNCRIPEGKDVGKPVKLRDWQQDFIKRIYDNPHGTTSFGPWTGLKA